MLFKPVQVQKIPFGADPKSVLCQFFKAGNCEKGTAYSHPSEGGGEEWEMWVGLTHVWGGYR